MTVMRLGWLCFAYVLISNGEVYAKNVAASWFPVEVGNKWIYEHETRDDIGQGRAHLDIHRGEATSNFSRSSSACFAIDSAQ